MKPGVGLLLGGRYRLVSRIAIGGMGEVWVAEDRALGREVAVKVLREEYAGNEDFLARLRAEARNNASLSHRNIAQMYDYGEQDGAGYLVMELVHGEPMADLLEREPVVPLAKLLPILAQTAHGLSAAHKAGVVHRDIKPGNILLDRSGDVKITDFGVSLSANQIPMTATGMVMGTAQYLSPEQATGEAATGASDVYALGIVAYESVAGKRPFTGKTPVDIAVAHVNEEVPALPAGVDPELAEYIYAMLAKDPARRPHPAKAVAEKFEAIARRVAQDPWAPAQVAPRLHRSRHASAEVPAGRHGAPAPDDASAGPRSDGRPSAGFEASRPAPRRDRRLTTAEATPTAAPGALVPPAPSAVEPAAESPRGSHLRAGTQAPEADIPRPPSFEPWARQAPGAAPGDRTLPASRSERRRQAEQRAATRFDDARSSAVFDDSRAAADPFDHTGRRAVGPTNAGRAATRFDDARSSAVFDDSRAAAGASPGRDGTRASGTRRSAGADGRDEGAPERVIELTPSWEEATKPAAPRQARPAHPRRQESGPSRSRRQDVQRSTARRSGGGRVDSDRPGGRSTRSRAAQNRAALSRRRTRLARIVAVSVLVVAAIVIFFAYQAKAATAEGPAVTPIDTTTIDAPPTHSASGEWAASGMINPSPRADAPAVRL